MEVITMETKAFKELEAKIDAIADFVANNQVTDNAGKSSARCPLKPKLV